MSSKGAGVGGGDEGVESYTTMIPSIGLEYICTSYMYLYMYMYMYMYPLTVTM